MRATPYALLFATMLLLAPVAMADDDDDDARDHEKHEKREKRDADRRERAQERLADVSSDYDNRTAARLALFDGVIAKLQSMRASYLENSTRIKAECAPLYVENATKDDVKAYKDCLREGQKEWRHERRTERKALVAELRELIHEIRGKSHGRD